jgi:ankyrin repeat protein
MNSFILLDENIIISHNDMLKFVSMGYARYEHLVGPSDLIKKSFIDPDFRKTLDYGFSILLKTYFFISEKRIIYKNEANMILKQDKFKRINHFIGTKSELLEYSKDRTAFNNLHTDLMFNLLSKNKFELGSVDKLSMMNIANYMTDESVGLLSRVSKTSQKVSDFELINRAKNDKKIAAKVGYDNILRNLEPLIAKRIYLAAEVGNIDYLETMLSSLPEQNKHINVRTLKNASKYGNIDIVKWMINKGSINFENYGVALTNTFNIASKHGHMDIVKFMIKNCNVRFYAALSFASAGGRMDIVQLLINYGADDFNAALSSAARIGHMDIIRLMIKKGANEFNSALISAAEGGHIDIVKLMIKKGANEFNSALYSASKHGHMDIVKFLINEGADEFYIALSAAAEGGHMDIVKLMISKGIVMSDYPLPSATKGGNMDIVELLIKNGYVNFTDGMIGAADGGHIDIIKFMLKNGANDLNTALEYAALEGHLDIVKFLINKGANDLNTALNNALYKGSINIIKYIINKSLELDIEINIQDFIVKIRKYGYYEIENYLKTIM